MHPFLISSSEQTLYMHGCEPSATHQFIKSLEDRGVLLKLCSQNIDGLEEKAGIKNTVLMHGSFKKATCLNCNTVVDGEVIGPEIESQLVPYCSVCTTAGYRNRKKSSFYKPNIIFFGEELPSWDSMLANELSQTDLLIVMGTSLQVDPVNRIPAMLGENVPKILINRNALSKDVVKFDLELLGECDDITSALHGR